MSAGSGADQWLGVELRHLATLAAVVEAGSFKGAAVQLGYVQSAVSQQIASLERIVGHQLIERSPGPRPIVLTETGAALLARAERILARLNAVDADLEALAATGTASARIGIDPSLAPRVLPPFLLALARERPGLHVVPIAVADQRERVRLVERGDLAAAFVDLPLETGALDDVELHADPYVAVVPAGGPVTRLERSPTLDELMEEGLIGRWAQRVGRAPALPERDVPGDSLVQSLVAAGLGVAIIPALAFDGDERTVAVEIDDPVAPRILGLCWHRDRLIDDSVRAFLRAARAIWSQATSDARSTSER